MYTLKTLSIKTNSNAPIPGERLMLWVDAVFTNGTEDIAIDFKAENKQVLDDTLRSVIKRLETRDQIASSIDPATYVIPEPIQPPQPTEEELKAMAVAQKEAELQAEVARIKQEEEIKELAKTYPTIAAKLAEVESEKRRK